MVFICPAKGVRRNRPSKVTTRSFRIHQAGADVLNETTLVQLGDVAQGGVLRVQYIADG